MYIYDNKDGNKWVNNQIVRAIPNADKFQSLNLGRTSITDDALIDIGAMC